jgi:hypothetical protein
VRWDAVPELLEGQASRSPPSGFGSFDQPQAQDTRDDQKDRHDVIEQLRHDQDENAGDQGYDRLQMRQANSHFLSPQILSFGIFYRTWRGVDEFAFRARERT